MNALFNCEESQALTIEFRKLGWNAYSCDLEECSGYHPEWHLKMDAFEAIKLMNWNLMVAFPPCTYLTVSANHWYKDMPPRKSGVLVGKERQEARKQAIQFFMKLYNQKINHIAIENPIGVMSTEFRKPDQIIQPWMFGHGETKATCLWLKNLPKLIHSSQNTLFDKITHVEGREQKIFNTPPSAERSKIRSKTYPNIAKAMAIQWSEYIFNL